MRLPAVIFSLLAGFWFCDLHADDRESFVIDFKNLSRGGIVVEQFKSQGVVMRGVNWSHGSDQTFISTNILAYPGFEFETGTTFGDELPAVLDTDFSIVGDA